MSLFLRTVSLLVALQVIDVVYAADVLDQRSAQTGTQNSGTKMEELFALVSLRAAAEEARMLLSRSIDESTWKAFQTTFAWVMSSGNRSVRSELALIFVDMTSRLNEAEGTYEGALRVVIETLNESIDQRKKELLPAEVDAVSTAASLELSPTAITDHSLTEVPPAGSDGSSTEPVSLMGSSRVRSWRILDMEPPEDTAPQHRGAEPGGGSTEVALSVTSAPSPYAVVKTPGSMEPQHREAEGGPGEQATLEVAAGHDRPVVATLTAEPTVAAPAAAIPSAAPDPQPPEKEEIVYSPIPGSSGVMMAVGDDDSSGEGWERQMRIRLQKNIPALFSELLEAEEQLMDISKRRPRVGSDGRRLNAPILPKIIVGISVLERGVSRNLLRKPNGFKGRVKIGVQFPDAKKVDGVFTEEIITFREDADIKAMMGAFRNFFLHAVLQRFKVATDVVRSGAYPTDRSAPRSPCRSLVGPDGINRRYSDQ